MTSDLEVDTGALRSGAAAVTGLAGRVSGTAAAVPDVDPAPRWATTGATSRAAEAARRAVSVLGHDLAGTADRINTVAGDYEAADARAAARLRPLR